MYKQKITPFLTFNGQALEAMNYYVSILKDAKITRQTPYNNSSPMAKEGDEEKILHGAMELSGEEIIFLDMVGGYEAPAFTWSNSLLINCETESEFDGLFDALAKEGSVMMGPESVGDIRKCAWVTDKFGVTWQPVWK